MDRKRLNRGATSPSDTEGFFQLKRHEFGPNRKRGGHPIAGQLDPNLWTIRQKIDLRTL